MLDEEAIKPTEKGKKA